MNYTAHQKPLNIINKGCTRVVFLIGNYAIKLPVIWNYEFFLKGLLGNINESKISKLSPHLCPVVFCMWGGWLLVMKRATELSSKEYSLLGRPVAFRDPLVIEYTEKKADSWGRYKGKLVAIDYGTRVIWRK